jgi:hypothetical protein
MTDSAPAQKADRPPLPRDAFRAQRAGAPNPERPPIQPVVVTPTYDDQAIAPPATSDPTDAAPPRKQPRAPRTRGRNPFDAYGERSSSRPYALRLPDPIDLVVRQMAAEERTQPLRIIDRIVYDHLKRIGRLPPPRDP